MLEILRDYFLFLPAEIVGAIIFGVLQISMLAAMFYAVALTYQWIGNRSERLARVPYVGRPIVLVLAIALALYPAMILYAAQEHVAYAILNTVGKID